MDKYSNSDSLFGLKYSISHKKTYIQIMHNYVKLYYVGEKWLQEKHVRKLFNMIVLCNKKVV